MYQNLEVFRMAHAMAVHAGAHQTIVARNIANADTPGYTARDLAPFKEVYDATGARAFAPRATRPDHMIQPAPGAAVIVTEDRRTETEPNGNSVSIETEMLKAVEVQRAHRRALAIYKSSIGVLRTSIGRR